MTATVDVGIEGYIDVSGSVAELTELSRIEMGSQ
jgi:hypothetical protein